jgi:hypothetical protein
LILFLSKGLSTRKKKTYLKDFAPNTAETKVFFKIILFPSRAFSHPFKASTFLIANLTKLANFRREKNINKQNEKPEYILRQNQNRMLGF